MSFVEGLDEEALAFFNEACKKKHSEQAVAFLNAYWEEIGDQADFIFSVAWEIMKKVEMDNKVSFFLFLFISSKHAYTRACTRTLDLAYVKMRARTHTHTNTHTH